MCVWGVLLCIKTTYDPDWLPDILRPQNVYFKPNVNIIDQIDLYTPYSSLSKFCMAKTNFLWPRDPKVSYFNVKTQCWTFWENWRVDPHSNIDEISSVYIRDREALEPSGNEFDRVL